MGLDQYIYSRRVKNGNEKEIAYWRKQYDLDKLFEKHLKIKIENCQYHKLSREVVENVLKDLNDIDNEYISEYTIKILSGVLSNINDDKVEYYYLADW